MVSSFKFEIANNTTHTRREQINKLSIGQLENRLDRSTQRLNRLVSKTVEKKSVVNENRTLRLDALRILAESIESIKVSQQQVIQSRKEVIESKKKSKISTRKCKNCKERARVEFKILRKIRNGSKAYRHAC